MRYAKLINNRPVYAPNPIHYGHVWRCNPPGEVYAGLGYKPVTETPYPSEEPQAGYRWEERWAETETAIVREWVQVEIPPDEEISAEEALEIILGGAE